VWETLSHAVTRMRLSTVLLTAMLFTFFMGLFYLQMRVDYVTKQLEQIEYMLKQIEDREKKNK
jgi:hypothetical protein